MTGEKEEIQRRLIEKHPAIIEIKHPCRILVIGRSQSGKTTISADIVMWLHSQVDDIYLVSPTYNKQPTWIDIKKYISFKHENLPKSLAYVDRKLKEDGHQRKSLLVLDDVSFDKALNEGNKGILNSFAYNARWLNLSLLVICHKVSNVAAGVRENLEHLVLFNTINNKELETIYENFGFIKDKKMFKQVMKMMIEDKILSGEDPYPFIYVCFQHGIRIYDKFNERLLLQ